MIKVRFTAPAVYQTVPPVRYAPGDIHEFRDDIAQRWLSRGVAVEHVDEPPAVPVMPVEIPEGWTEFKAAEMVKLARDLGAPDGTDTKSAAAEFIVAEMARRAGTAG